MNDKQLLDEIERKKYPELNSAIKFILQHNGLIDENGVPTVDSFEVLINGISLKHNK